MNTAPTISTLFVVEPHDLASRRSEGAKEAVDGILSQILPLLNYTSSCYLVGGDKGTDVTFFGQAFRAVRDFLDKHPFLQVSLRPVHTLSSDSMEAWRALYREFLTISRPFHEEGYRQQIVSRLRLFPILFFPDVPALESARGFLHELHKNFLLPSILFPRTQVSRDDPHAARKTYLQWERVFLTDGIDFDPDQALHTLVSNALVDTLAEPPETHASPHNPILCKEILILEESGGTRNCLHTANPPEDAGMCGPCIYDMFDHTEASFVLNERVDTWRETCDAAATFFRRTGRNRDAFRLWQRCMHGYPEGKVPADLRTKAASCLYEQGDLEGAMSELQEARRVDPDSPMIRYYMGLCEFGWKDYIEAADRFREAVDLGLPGPLKREAEYFRGESHAHLEEHEECLQALTAAEEQGKQDSPLHFYKGLAFLGTGRPEAAQIELKKALSLGPTPGDLFHVLFYIAYACKESENYAEALDHCRQAIRVEETSQEIHNLMGFCLFKLKRFDDAIRCFEKAIAIDPTSAIDYANIGSNLREKGDVEGALTMYRKALSLDPGIDFARENLERLEKKRT